MDTSEKYDVKGATSRQGHVAVQHPRFLVLRVAPSGAYFVDLCVHHTSYLEYDTDRAKLEVKNPMIVQN